MNKDLYPASEHHLIDQLHSLFSRWRKAVDAEGLPGLSGDLLVTDGLYPRYTMQKIRLLFIGRETLEMEGEDYIDVLFSAYKEQRVAGTSLNGHQFHSLMLRLAWAVQNRLPPWEQVPPASDLAEQLGMEGGFSFAFMNLSKLSNESGSWQADRSLISRFIQLSCPQPSAQSSAASTRNPPGNLILEEIQLLAPHLIITMNIGEYFPRIGSFLPVEYGPDVSLYQLELPDGRLVPVADTHHFSAPGKSPQRDYYQPLVQLWPKTGL